MPTATEWGSGQACFISVPLALCPTSCLPAYLPTDRPTDYLSTTYLRQPGALVERGAGAGDEQGLGPTRALHTITTTTIIIIIIIIITITITTTTITTTHALVAAEGCLVNIDTLKSLKVLKEGGPLSQCNQ